MRFLERKPIPVLGHLFLESSLLQPVNVLICADAKVHSPRVYTNQAKFVICPKCCSGLTLSRRPCILFTGRMHTFSAVLIYCYKGVLHIYRAVEKKNKNCRETERGELWGVCTKSEVKEPAFCVDVI